MVSRTSTRRSRGEGSCEAASSARAAPAECPAYAYGSSSTRSSAATTPARSRRCAASPMSAVTRPASAASSRGVTPTTSRPRRRRWWARLSPPGVPGVRKSAAKFRPPPGRRYATACGGRAVSASTSTVTGAGPPSASGSVSRTQPSPVRRVTGPPPSAARRGRADRRPVRPGSCRPRPFRPSPPWCSPLWVGIPCGPVASSPYSLARADRRRPPGAAFPVSVPPPSPVRVPPVAARRGGAGAAPARRCPPPPAPGPRPPPARGPRGSP